MADDNVTWSGKAICDAHEALLSTGEKYLVLHPGTGTKIDNTRSMWMYDGDSQVLFLFINGKSKGSISTLGLTIEQLQVIINTWKF